EQDPGQVPLITNVLTAVLGDFCARYNLAANLVANTQDVKLLVRARLQGLPLPEESQLTRGWRGSHVLPLLLAVLDGRCSVRITDIDAEAPFTVTDDGPVPGPEDKGR